MGPFTHVFWDWNGTLLDDARTCVRAINVLLRRRGLPAVTPRRYAEVFDFPVRNYYLKLGFDFGRENWQALAEEYHRAYYRAAASAPLRQGARAVLRALRAGGIEMAVISASEQRLLEHMLTRRRIRSFFRCVQGLNDLFAASKLAAARVLMGRMGADPAHVLLVGDTVHDVETADEIGCACVLLPGGHQSAERLHRTGRPLISDLFEVIGLLGVAAPTK